MVIHVVSSGIARVVTHVVRVGEMAHSDPSIREAEASRSLSLGPVWSTNQVSGWPGLHRESLP